MPSPSTDADQVLSRVLNATDLAVSIVERFLLGDQAVPPHPADAQSRARYDEAKKFLDLAPALIEQIRQIQSKGAAGF